MVYETSTVTSSNIMPHLWIYRPQITIDRVTQSMEQKTASDELKILKKFLSEVMLLLLNKINF